MNNLLKALIVAALVAGVAIAFVLSNQDEDVSQSGRNGAGSGLHDVAHRRSWR